MNGENDVLKPKSMRKAAVIIWLGLLGSGIAMLFWHVEWVYNLPTPVPLNFHDLLPGQHVSIESSIKSDNDKPVLLHFFNPDCPCSKFNKDHFKTLVKRYGSKVQFVIAPISEEKHSEKEIQDFFGLKLPVVFDSSLAATCGVYSTPQAVLIDRDDKLYYKGNYNKSRYCTDTKSEYVVMALDSLLNRKPNPLFSQYALKAYGCKLPG